MHSCRARATCVTPLRNDAPLSISAWTDGRIIVASSGRSGAAMGVFVHAPLPVRRGLPACFATRLAAGPGVRLGYVCQLAVCRLTDAV